jgi:hypothetical protein
LFPNLDAEASLALEAWKLFQESLSPEHPTDLGFIFRLLGIRVGSEHSREIYERMLMIKRIAKEYEELTKSPDAQTNGAQTNGQMG